MLSVSVQEASHLTGKIYRHISEGKLSKTPEGKIDTAELLRVYGAFKSTSDRNHSLMDGSKIHHENENESWLKSQIEKLQTELKEQRAEFLEREKRLLALLENKSDNIPTTPSFFGNRFKK